MECGYAAAQRQSSTLACMIQVQCFVLSRAHRQPLRRAPVAEAATGGNGGSGSVSFNGGSGSGGWWGGGNDGSGSGDG
jgi:hypothetical protein